MGGLEFERIKLFESFKSFKPFKSVRDLLNFLNELNCLNEFTVREVSMENPKVKSLMDSRLRVISRSEQPAAEASTSGLPKPKLLDQVRQAIRTRHYSPRTEETYVGWIKRFIFFHNKRHPAEISLFVRESCITGSSRSSRLSRSSGFKDP